MQKYYTGLLALEGCLNERIFCKGRGWQIGFESNPSCGILTGPIHEPEPAKEIVVWSDSIERAQYAIDLVFAAYCLEVGELLDDEPNPVFPVRAETTREIAKQLMAGGGRNTGVRHLPVACLIAAKASQRLTQQNALFKYVVSHRIMPLAANALDPYHGWEAGRTVSEFPEQHVFYAHAIIAAYSVLEELSLELRASVKKPSRIKGQWNPIVKQELEDRLIKSRINLAEQVIWHLRDTPTKIERTRQPSGKVRCEWSSRRVRDEYLEVVDAISYASWLRSKVSSHRLTSLARSLTICDVVNVQHLARRLLLETLGFWHYHERHPEILQLYGVEGD